jgi:DNA-binding MarR family transcriptional regulator
MSQVGVTMSPIRKNDGVGGEEDRERSDKLHSLVRVTGILATSLDHSIPLSYIRAFLCVAQKEGLGPSEYAKMYGTTQPMMSRYLIELSIRGRNAIRKSGLGLVERVSDSEDLRAQRYFLTVKGRQVLNECLVYMADRSARA